MKPVIKQPADRSGAPPADRAALRRPALLLALMALAAGIWTCGPKAVERSAQSVHPLWKRNFRGEVVALAADAAAKLLVVATREDTEGKGENHLYALDENGTILWHLPLARRVAGIAVAGDGSIVLAYLVDGALLAWGRHGGKRWESACIGIPEVSASGERIVCWSAGDEDVGGMALEALNGKGRRLWSFDDPGGIWHMTLADGGDVLAAVTLAGQVIVVNGKGRVLWKRPLSTQVGTVAIASGGETRIAVGTGIEGESLAVYDLAGEEIWRATVPGGVDSIAFSRDAGFLVTGNNTVRGQRIYVFNREGDLGWRFQLDRPAREPLRMQISEEGHRVVAVLEEEGQPTLLVWDAHGDLTARMRVGANIVDYALARDGGSLAALTGSDKIVYYRLGGGVAEPEAGP